MKLYSTLTVSQFRMIFKRVLLTSLIVAMPLFVVILTSNYISAHTPIKEYTAEDLMPLPQDKRVSHKIKQHKVAVSPVKWL